MITLGIIGVVAALTMPALVANYKKHVTVTRLKTLYSMFSQAALLSQVDNGESWEWPSSQCAGSKNVEFFETYYKPYLKLVKDCGTGNGCGIASNGCSQYGILANGVSFRMYTNYPYKETVLEVDINGLQGPDKGGVDRFMYLINEVGKMYSYEYVAGFTSTGDKRTDWKLRCEASPSTCAGLIQADGWEIRDDYPWF